jgi:prepilin-type N-terminal cleavage/methylation domain-containing protein
MFRKHKNKGFSLVELIVAISILAVLMAVLTPSYLAMLQDSRVKKDESKFESVCTAFKKALGEPEVRNEIEDIAGENQFQIIFYIDQEGIITFEDGDVIGDLDTKTMRDTILWLNSYQSTAMTYTVENKTICDKFLVFTLTPKTATTTAQCKYEIMDEKPL